MKSVLDVFGFHFRCKDIIKQQKVHINNLDDLHAKACNRLKEERDQLLLLRTQIEEAKIIYDTMDKELRAEIQRHIGINEGLVDELVQVKERHLKAMGEVRRSDCEAQATVKYAYDAERKIDALEAEKTHLLGIIDGLKKDFEGYVSGLKPIDAKFGDSSMNEDEVTSALNVNRNKHIERALDCDEGDKKMGLSMQNIADKMAAILDNSSKKYDRGGKKIKHHKKLGA